MTNLEKIKQDINAMTAEQFEETYGDMVTTCPEAYGQKCEHSDDARPPCFDCSVKWLKSEYKRGAECLNKESEEK